MLMCLKCGKLNEPDENYCVYCGASLPKLAYAIEMAAVDEQMDLYYKFFEAVDQVKAGGITGEDFEAFMNEMYDKLKERDEDLHFFYDNEIDDEIKPDFVEEFETGFQGLDMISEGMESMSEFLEDGEESHLDQGLEMIKQGLKTVHKARRLNREREKHLSLDVEAYRSEQSMEL